MKHANFIYLLITMLFIGGCVTAKDPATLSDSRILHAIGGTYDNIYYQANKEPFIEEALKRNLIREEKLGDIRSSRISHGMTLNEVIASWGFYQNINRDYYEFGTRTQIVYNSAYIYLTDGFVSSISTRSRY